MGAHGRHRTFITCRDENLKLTSNLDALGTTTYFLDSHANMPTVLGAARTKVEDMMKRDLARHDTS